MILRLLTFLLLMISGTLSAVVLQKAAVLPLVAEGENREWEFLTRTLSQQVEIALDRTEKMMVIRRYLWKDSAGGDETVMDAASAAGFALRANLEAVVFGTVSNRSGEAIIVLSAYDAVTGRIAAQARFVLPLSEELFAESEAPIGEFVGNIVAVFPALTEREIRAARRRVKVVYRDISRPVHQLRFSFIPSYDLVGMEYFKDKVPVGTGVTNQARYSPQPGALLTAGYRFRAFEFEAGMRVSFGDRETFIANPFATAGVWLFRDTFKPGLRIGWMTKDSGPVKVSGLITGFSFDVKPSDDFLFGLFMAPSMIGTTDVPLFSGTGYRKESYFSICGGFRFEIRVTKRIFAEFQLGLNNFGTEWEAETGIGGVNNSLSIESAGLGVVWKTSWGTR